MKSHRQSLLRSQWDFCPDQNIVLPSLIPLPEDIQPVHSPYEEIFWSLSAGTKRKSWHVDQTEFLVLSKRLRERFRGKIRSA